MPLSSKYSLPFAPKVTNILTSVLIDDPFYILNFIGMESFSYIWLLLLNTLYLEFIHIVVSVFSFYCRMAFHFMKIPPNLFIDSLVDKYLGFFQF